MFYFTIYLDKSYNPYINSLLKQRGEEEKGAISPLFSRNLNFLQRRLYFRMEAGQIPRSIFFYPSKKRFYTATTGKGVEDCRVFK